MAVEVTMEELSKQVETHQEGMNLALQAMTDSLEKFNTHLDKMMQKQDDEDEEKEKEEDEAKMFEKFKKRIQKDPELIKFLKKQITEKPMAISSDPEHQQDVIEVGKSVAKQVPPDEEDEEEKPDEEEDWKPGENEEKSVTKMKKQAPIIPEEEEDENKKKAPVMPEIEKMINDRVQKMVDDKLKKMGWVVDRAQGPRLAGVSETDAIRKSGDTPNDYTGALDALKGKSFAQLRRIELGLDQYGS